MALKNYYELLELPPTASADEIKESFRAQIARYHPDKVQHLGKEFQSMAADRAAELTEAYRICPTPAAAPSTTAPSPRRRRQRAVRAGAAAGHGRRAQRRARQPSPSRRRRGRRPHEPAAPRGGAVQGGARDPRRVRPQGDARAACGRRSTRSAATTSETQLRGFDLALRAEEEAVRRQQEPAAARRGSSRRSIARRSPTPGRRPSKWGDTKAEEVCVLLLGTSLAPAGELAGEIAEQRKQIARRQGHADPGRRADWNAHMPLDAPAIAKTLLARLKSGT